MTTIEMIQAIRQRTLGQLVSDDSDVRRYALRLLDSLEDVERNFELVRARAERPR